MNRRGGYYGQRWEPTTTTDYNQTYYEAGTEDSQYTQGYEEGTDQTFDEAHGTSEMVTGYETAEVQYGYDVEDQGYEEAAYEENQYNMPVEYQEQVPQSDYHYYSSSNSGPGPSPYVKNNFGAPIRPRGRGWGRGAFRGHMNQPFQQNRPPRPPFRGGQTFKSKGQFGIETKFISRPSPKVSAPGNTVHPSPKPKQQNSPAQPDQGQFDMVAEKELAGKQTNIPGSGLHTQRSGTSSSQSNAGEQWSPVKPGTSNNQGTAQMQGSGTAGIMQSTGSKPLTANKGTRQSTETNASLGNQSKPGPQPFESKPGGGQGSAESMAQRSGTTWISGDTDRAREQEPNYDEGDDSSSDEDTDYCKYCKLSFTTLKAYHSHTRGMQHTTLVMEAKAKKGDQRFQKEVVHESIESMPGGSQSLAESMPLGNRWIRGETDRATEQEPNYDEGDNNSSDEDTDFCKYCKLSFTTPKAYHSHTRGLQHTTLVMEAKAKQGDQRFQKEVVHESVLEVHIPEPKTQEVEPVEEEPNWMDLDDDVIDYIKSRKNPEERDLTPSEIGKNPIPDDFNCPLCNIKCTGAGAFKMHIEGKQHRNNLEAVKAGVKLKKKKQPVPGVMIEAKERPSKFSEMVKENKTPILGLEFVTEFQKTDIKAAARYVCNLCESKCDGSTIVPHVIGLKHRLKYMQVRKPSMYEHLTKYNSRKKKSEMNANLEDFAREIEQEVGRGDVRVKVELEDFEDEDDLAETMKRHSKALAEKVKALEAGDDAFADDEPVKKMPRKELPDPRRPRFPERDPYYEDYRRAGPRWSARWDPRDSYIGGRHRFEDFRASYRDRFRFTGDDRMYERRMYEERRHLEDLMLERHRLSDPYAERRRIDDIMMRRRYLDELEQDRLQDILERKKRLMENDVDYLRLQRFADRESTTQNTGISLEEKKRLDDLLARREALKIESQAEMNKRDVQNIQEKLVGQTSTDPTIAEQQIKAAQALQEEADKNPNVNIGEILSNLSTSMIATEDDAAMALQISNALTQALLKYRLQNASKELSSITDTIKPMLEKKKPELSIPGLGNMETPGATSSSVPSFLRTPQETTPNSFASPAQSYPSPGQSFASQGQSNSTSQSSSLAQTVDFSQFSYTTAQPSYTSPLLSYTTTPLSYTSTLPSYSSAPPSNTLAPQSYTAPLSYNSPIQSSYHENFTGTAAQALGASLSSASMLAQMQQAVTLAPTQTAASSSVTDLQTTAVLNTKNIDQPQKLLLESIRKQTELLKQKIAATAVAQKSIKSSAVTVHSQMKHVPGTEQSPAYPNPYTVTQPVTAGPVNVASSQNTVTGQVTSTAVLGKPSSQTLLYYEQNYKAAPPDAAPNVTYSTSLTNDLPSIRRKR